MEPITVAIPAENLKKRFGLIPARIGASLPHRLGVDMTIEEPLYSTTTHAVGSKSRTRLHPQKTAFAYARGARGELIATKALPGSVAYLEVQDISRLEPELADQVKWVCRHPDCAGKRHDSKESLIQTHPRNKDLVHEAESSPAGLAHVFYGVLEIPGTPEKKDEKSGKITSPSTTSTVLLLSDEE